ncbi:MarR family winged helix-turn-helix transcriptional regulator [uncultured Methanobrevibacter sp.]|uniref:MarR family winged helix-turn-helix transcriptional regulator n=1 Tax=uncultured Methanobrevibacter sp. TaxID=253161 RepID=UPI0025F3F36D|nr:MarR family transcriptional regulator [uncultured Methanobrevibacter sp.]
MLNNNSLDSLISIIDRSFKIACLDKFDELDLTFHNYMTLEFIYNHENVIQKDLARLFHRNQSTITRSIDKLENKGFVERIHDDNNKKNNIIILTTKGQKAVEEINSFKKDLEKDLVYNFTENEREIFKKLLNRLIHNFNSYIFK